MVKENEESNKWLLIDFFNKESLKNKEIVFDAVDLFEFFIDTERLWLQINGEDVCVSFEGYDCEPLFSGKIRTKQEE